MTRDCGDCVACCTYFPIEAIEKKQLTQCPNAKMKTSDRFDSLPVFKGLEKNGCNCLINALKPKVCKEYACMWIAGHGDDEDRPDRSGVLCDTLLRIENAIQCKPLWKGAQDAPEGRRAIERISISTGKPCLVAGFPETHIVRVVGKGIN